MRTKLFLTALVAFFFCISSLNAQDNATKTKSTKETKSSTAVKSDDGGKAIKEELKKSRATTKSTYTPIVKSVYNNQEKLILSYLNINYIPKSFPKYNDTMTDKQYEDLMKKWASENKSFLKEEFKNQF